MHGSTSLEMSRLDRIVIATKMKTEVVLSKHTCATHGCGITYWLEEGFEERRQKDKRDFYCPNGHSHVYFGETDAQKLARVTREKNEEIYRLEAELKKKNRKKRS